MKKIITFSIAAYNVEKYLQKLLDSVLDNRILDEIEVIVVNDGSTDKTAEISRQYHEKYPEVVSVINKENGGHGSTINKGMQEAKGKYFRALDGDDWVNSEDLVYLVSKLRTNESDLILCNYVKCYENGKMEKENFTGLESERQYFFDEAASITGWMRYHTVIYKTELLKKNNICLDEHCFYVDSEFMIFPIPYINTITFYNCHLYCYRLGLEGQSVSPTGRINHSAESYKVTKSLLSMFKSLPDNVSAIKRTYVADSIGGHCIWHFRTIMSYKPSVHRKSELICYEKMIQESSDKIFKGMEKFGSQSILIKALRRSKYILYRPICIYKQIKNN